MYKPLITVAMPVFNAGVFLKPALNSIINQTYTNWELIIIDDGSSDGCLDNLPELDDSRIKVYRDGKNKGIAPRLNEIIDLAKGEFIARMDSDDISHPQRFELQLGKLQCQPELDLVSARAVTINKQNIITGELPFRETHDEICAKPWLGFYMPHPTWMGRLVWFKKYRYKVPQSYYSEDCELLLRSYESSKFACLPEILFEYRMKNKINWKSQLKARSAVLKLQTSHFYNQGHYLYMVLSSVAFILRITLDFFKVVKQLLNKT